jgi:quercetin dioxygenase-like cupin family protein
MSNYPVTIDNGAGELLTFVGPVTENGVAYMIVENQVSPRSGPPMHVHHKQHEEITVLEGVMGTQVLGQEPQFYKAGETVLFEAGVAHKFWNAGDTMMKGTGRVWPIHNIEYFLTEIYRSVKAGKGHRPSLMDTAFLLRRYRSEFDMLEIPPFVKRTILPAAYFVGKLTGAFKKFDNAPAPVR